MAELLKGKNVEKRQGDTFTKVDPESHLQGKVVGLYFSGHWCGSCRKFTPILKDFYEQVTELPFEIVFVTHDKTEEEMKSYVTQVQGNWCVIPFGDPEIEQLITKYKISGIPSLVIIKANGDVVKEDAENDVEEGKKSPLELVTEWKKGAGL